VFQRQRRWVNLQEAVECVKGADFRAALKRFAYIMARLHDRLQNPGQSNNSV
jgi:hypothetical protein